MNRPVVPAIFGVQNELVENLVVIAPSWHENEDGQF